MQINTEESKKRLAFASACFLFIIACLIALYGLFFLLCWHFGFYSLLTYSSCNWILPYPAALCMFLSGVALLSIFQSKRKYWTNVLGVPIFLMGCIGVAEFLFKRDFGFDDFFIKLLIKTPPNFPHLAVIGALGFTCIGLVFCLWPQKRHTHFRSSVLLLLSLIIFFFGITDVLSYMLPLKATLGLNEPLLIHCYTAFGQLAIGLALVFARFYTDIRNSIGLIRWLPVVLALSFSVFTITIWLGIKAEKALVIEQVVNSKQFESSDIVSNIVLFGGFVIAGALALFSYLLIVNRERFLQIENAKKELQEQRVEEKRALQSANVGTWNWDMKKDIFNMDTYTLSLFGIRSEGLTGSFELFKEMIFIDDRETFNLAIDRTLTTGLPLDITFRIPYIDGTQHSFLSKGNVFFDNDKKPEKMIGVIWDITSIKLSEKFLSISESISKILGNAASIHIACVEVIDFFYVHFGWELMVIWHNDPVLRELKCIEAVSCSQRDFPLFKKMVREEESQVVKYIETAYRPILCEDISKNIFPGYSQAAKEEGFKGALIFPIFEKGRVAGAVELFKTSILIDEMTEGLRNLISSLGIEIGQFIQRKTVEEEIMRLASIVTYANEGIYSYNMNGIVLSWNNGAEKIYGWKAAEIIGKSIEKIYPNPEELRSFIAKPHNFLESSKVARMRKDGSTILVDSSTSLIFNERELIIGFSNISQDVTKQIQMIEDLRRSEEKFRDFIETTEEWIWEMNTSFVFTYSNPFIEHILGYTAQEVIGKSIFLFIPEKMRQDVEKEMKNFFNRKKSWVQHVLCFRHKNGSFRFLESNAEPIFNESHDLVGFRGSDRDITERKNIEKVKGEFISMVSHELRTPLTSVSGAVDLLLAQKPKDEKTRDLLMIAQRNAQRLAAIINDILDIEKIQLGRFALNIAPVSVADAAREAIKSSLLLAEKFSIKLIEEGEYCKSKVNADYGRLIQVFMNLLSNAIKFSPKEGSVYISVIDIGDRVRAIVKDQGKGIPIDFQPEIFVKFAQADASDSRSISGTGLGLSISKNLIEHMGGTIGFKSQENVGTIFFFDLAKLPED